jgi:hypothetical protein
LPAIIHGAVAVLDRWLLLPPKGSGEVAGDQPPAAARALEALMGEEDGEILKIARSGASADNRMREICRIDRTKLAWDSQRWVRLLDVSRQAIEKTTFWVDDRPAAIEAARD